jgi:hypothetical protein
MLNGISFPAASGEEKLSIDMEGKLKGKLRKFVFVAWEIL